MQPTPGARWSKRAFGFVSRPHQMLLFTAAAQHTQTQLHTHTPAHARTWLSMSSVTRPAKSPIRYASSTSSDVSICCGGGGGRGGFDDGRSSGSLMIGCASMSQQLWQANVARRFGGSSWGQTGLEGASNGQRPASKSPPHLADEVVLLHRVPLLLEPPADRARLRRGAAVVGRRLRGGCGAIVVGGCGARGEGWSGGGRVEERRAAAAGRQ